jgi:hypothetical protein
MSPTLSVWRRRKLGSCVDDWNHERRGSVTDPLYSIDGREGKTKSLFAAKWCCLQWITFCYRNCVVRRESVFTVENQCLLPKLCCLQWISVCCRNCLVCTELVFTVESCWLQRISFRCRNRVIRSESVFAVEIVLSTTNQCLLPRLCCLQRIHVRFQNCVANSESMFVAETVLSATNQRSLPKLCCLHQIRFHCRIVLSATN